jgi:hypothetical protein
MLTERHGSVESIQELGFHSTHLTTTCWFERLSLPSRTPIFIISSSHQCMNNCTIPSHQDFVNIRWPKVHFGSLGSRFHHLVIHG